MAHGANVVLVIEDEPNVIRVIRASLENRQAEFASALDGESGLEMARDLHPSLVLLDLALPDLDGWEVLARIRADHELAETKVVIVTAQGDSATAADSKRLGADGFVAKPFRPSDLRRAVDRFLPLRSSEPA